MHHRRFAYWRTLLILVSALLVSCASHKPEPESLAPAANATALESRTLDDPRLKSFLLAMSTPQNASGAETSWDLANLTLAALFYHPELDVARAKLASAAAAVTTAAQIPNPSLGLDLIHNGTAMPLYPSAWTVGLISNFLLETFGRREYRTAEAQALVDAARDDLATSGWQVRGRVRTALFNSWAAERRLGLTRQRFDLQDQLVRLLENRFAVGEASALDVTRERINRNQISLAIRDAERQGAEARAQLATAIGVPVRALDAVELSFAAFDRPVPLRSDAATGEFRREALLNRTDVQSLLAEYASAQSGLQLQIASRFPNLNLGPGYAYDQGENTYSLNVSAELPVFNRNQGPIAEAEARRKDVSARFTALQAQIIGAIDQAATAYRSATATLSTADVLIEDQQRRQSQIESSFRAGQTDRPTLVATELELAAVQLSRFDALVLQLQAVGALEDALQQPLFDPRSGPRVPEQNPRLTHKEEPLP